MFKLLPILPWLFLMFQPLNAKVEAPNYKFDPKVLEVFFPGKTLAGIEAKHGKGEALGKSKEFEILKFQVKDKQYNFSVLVQQNEGVVHDFHARLPSYFLHDVFFQDLIKVLGKQDVYKKTLEEAYYQWNKNDLVFVYSASCTITCFPVFFGGYKKDSFSFSLLGKMKEANAP